MFDRTDEALRDRDNLKWTTTPAGVIPAWVADMDVAVPEAVTRRVHELLARGDVGYPDFEAPDPLVAAFETRMAERFGWTPAGGRGRLFTDVIQAFQVLTDLLTEPGDGIALHVPTYPVFLESVHDTGRRVVPVPFGATADELVESWRREGVRLVVVVNPHNPLGRMLDAEELRPLADAAAELDLVVLAHLGPARVREPIAALPFAYLGGVSTLSRAAAVAAWTEGGPWLAELVGVLQRNRDTITAWAAEVGVGVVPAEATYLAWLDFAGTSIAEDPAGAILERGRVRLSAGPDFTAHTPLDSSTFARLNFGTSPERLAQILERIASTL